MGSIYRSRVGGEYAEEAARFVSSLAEDARIFEEDLDGTEAHDIMLHEQGIIDFNDLVKILVALEKLRKEYNQGKARLEGDYEDVHEFIEAYVIQEVGIQVGGKLHTGRSRNDQVAVDIRMRLRKDLDQVSRLVLGLVQVLLSKAEKYLDSPMILYTHTQHAQVGTFGHYLLAYAEELTRDFQRLQDCYDRVNLCPLGGGPMGGTSFRIDRERTAKLLGFDGLVRNSLDATSSRDFMLEASSCLAILMVGVSRIAEDLVLWSSSEFGYVELSEQLSSVSSIMPQKKNPTVLELIRGKSSRVVGNLTTLLGIMKGLNSGYSSDLQETKPVLWDSFDQTVDSLKILICIFISLNIQPERMTKAISESYVFAVDLAEQLAIKGIVSFREAHQVVGYLIRDIVSQSLGPDVVRATLVEMAARKVLGRQIQVDSNLVAEALDPMKSIARRKPLGGPNPEQCRRMLMELRETSTEGAAVLSTRKQRLEASKKSLSETVGVYTGASSNPQVKYGVGKGSALIIVDVQNDFCPGGILAVPKGDEIIPILNEYITRFREAGALIFATRDWHPSNHISFNTRGGPWPPHCIRASKGAAFHNDLKLPSEAIIISKARNPDTEAYSGFRGTRLSEILKHKGVETVFVGGLATDYCVKSTILDALKDGLHAFLLVDAIRAVELKPDSSERAIEEIVAKGARLAYLSQIVPTGKIKRKKTDED